MANPEHLKILKNGIKAWNTWRDENDERLTNSHSDWSKVFVEPDLSGADLQKMNLRGANLSGVNFKNVNLRSAILGNVDLTMSNFSGACLANTYLGFSNLYRTILAAANLSGAMFTRTNLQDTVLTNADLTGAEMFFTTINNVDLSEVKNLESIIHTGPSSIGIDTIYLSRGNISEKFLRGCGVSEDFITYMRSLTGKAIEFYSCFISYSSKDEEFAKRLYNDLQSEGVRCWFAPEDLKIGDRFRVRIDEAVRLYDKLLLVLSENSVASQWVEKEVETAFEKEAEQGKTVLFPVQLDDAVSEIKTGWAADIRRTRHTGDFRDWKNHDSYKKAFERLMRDLKAGEKK